MANKISTLRFIRCAVGNEIYGLDMFWVRGIQRTDLLRRDPETEGGDLITGPGTRPIGWLPRREGDIPVFSLASLLGRAPDDAAHQNAMRRIVVLNSPTAEDQPWALLVDRVSQVIQTPMERVAPVPPVAVNPTKDHFEGVIRLGGALTLLLSPARLHPDAAPRVVLPATAHPPAFQGREQAPAIHRGQGQIVVFSTNPPQPEERAMAYGLSITQVPEILRPLPLIPVPAAPGFVLGLANWRDRPVPVVDLDTRLGLASEARASANGRTRLVVARDRGASGQEMLAGFLIRPTIRTLRLPLAHQASDRALPLERALTRGVVELEDETLVIPDVGRVVSNQ